MKCMSDNIPYWERKIFPSAINIESHQNEVGFFIFTDYECDYKNGS